MRALDLYINLIKKYKKRANFFLIWELWMRMMKKDTMLDLWNKRRISCSVYSQDFIKWSWYDTISWFKKINEPYEIAFQEKLKVVLATGWYILGNEVKNRNEFCKYCGTILHWYRKWSGCSGFDF
jgi:hypothetical protein